MPALFIDTSKWMIVAIQIKLSKSAAEQLGAATGLFRATTLDLPVRLVQSVGACYPPIHSDAGTAAESCRSSRAARAAVLASGQMDRLFTSSGLLALITLTFLEIVLGVDNVIFISIRSSKLPVSAARSSSTARAPGRDGNAHSCFRFPLSGSSG